MSDVSNNLSIRPATIYDAPRIAEIQVKTWRAVYVGKIAQDYLDQMSVSEKTDKWSRIITQKTPDQQIFVAVQDDVIVGFCSCGKSRDADMSHVGEVYALYVDCDYIGKGAGSVLMESALHHLQTLGFRSTLLWALDTNTLARTFYMKKGFIPDGMTKKEKFGSAEAEEIRYVRDLDRAVA